jgi:cobalt-zinc-cadmium efflux system membrane fusion protein
VAAQEPCHEDDAPGQADDVRTAEQHDDRARDDETSNRPLDLDELIKTKCEHDVPIVNCDDCRYEVGVAKINPALARGLVESQPVRAQTRVTKRLRLTGEIQPNLTRVVQVTSAGAGRVETIHKILGDTVKPSEVLAVIQSSEFGQAQAEFLQARAKLELAGQTFEREKRLHEQEISSQADFLAARNDLATAQAAAAAARKRLQLFGLSEAQIEALAKTDADSTLGRLVLASPIGGTVMEQRIVRGQFVTTSDTLYRIADLSRVWIGCDLYESDLAALHDSVASGKVVEAEIQVTAFPGTAFKATVDMIGSQVDRDTRTLKVRLAADNPQRKLKPGMFVTAFIDLGQAQTVLTVPETALLCDAGEHFVFVRLDDELWARRDVRIGRVEEGLVEVLGGLTEADIVATKGAFMLKGEVLKEKMGAGCAH